MGSMNSADSDDQGVPRGVLPRPHLDPDEEAVSVGKESGGSGGSMNSATGMTRVWCTTSAAQDSDEEAVSV